MLIPVVDMVAPTSSTLDVQLSSSMLNFVGHLGILGSVMLNIQNIPAQGGETLIEVVRLATNEAAIHVVGLEIDHDDLATKFLDKGVHVVYFNRSVEEVDLQIKVLQSLPPIRIGLNCVAESVTLKSLTDTIFQYKDHCSNFLFKLPPLDDLDAWRSITAIREKAMKIAATGIHISFILPLGSSERDASLLGSFHENINTVFYPKLITTLPDTPVIRSPVPHKDATIAEAMEQNLEDQIELDYIAAYITCLKSDRPDGLFSSVVCDEHDVCLGLVYSNEQSIRTAVTERRGVYWSRSRGGLWKKGETSGMMQVFLLVNFALPVLEKC